MSFVAIDCNVPSEWYGQVAGWGFDLICARPGETDYDFCERALAYRAVGFLSRDTDIYNVLDFKFKVDIPIAKHPKDLQRLS